MARSRLLALTGQLALLTLLVHRLELVSEAFLAVAVLTLVAFPVHRLLPPARRLAFFLAVSLAGLGLAVGWQAALWVVGLGTGLIALAHLPAPMGWRVGTLVAVTVLLAAARAGWLPSLAFHGGVAAVPPIAWAVLGSMFMFRLPLYLHDLAHRRPEFDWARTGSYFFLLPNSCFLLFPVVDHQVFRTGVEADDAGEVAQRGLAWMLHGVVHLLLYRWVERSFMIPATEVETVAELGRYLVANVALFLRVSGHFHLAVGMLGLFGFRLPRTHDRYFLAHGAGDYWRRINIYWKDFMAKTVYFPVFFRLRRRATSPWQQRWALATATAAVFAVSWFLHSYQWLWLLGSFPLRPQDALFWGLVGLWVVVFTLRSQRTGSTPPPTGWRRVGKILLTFTTVAALWSLWTAESLAELGRLWGSALVPPRSPGELAWLAAPALVLAGWAAGRRLERWLERRSDDDHSERQTRARITTAGTLALLSLFTLPAVPSLLGLPSTGPGTGVVLAQLEDLGTRRLGAADAARLERGYYEKVLQVNRLDSPLVAGLAAAGGDVEEAPAAAEARDEGGRPLFEERRTFRRFHLLPDRRGTYMGEPFTTDERGLRIHHPESRTRDEPGPGTYRIAVLGSSHVLGHGVADHETFVARLEERLRRDGMPGFPGEPPADWRVLNVAGIGTSPVQMLEILERDVLGGGTLTEPPDAALWVAHTSDALWTKRQLAWILVHDVPLPWPGLEELVARAGIDQATSNVRYQKRLASVSHAIVAWTYDQAARRCREQGVQPLWVLLPKLKEHGRRKLVPGLTAAAREAGFRVLEIPRVFTGVPRRDLQVGPADFHPNARGHERIADALYRQLTARPDVLAGAGPGDILSLDTGELFLDTGEP